MSSGLFVCCWSFYYYFYCCFWHAILMRDFNCKVINSWKSTGCRSHNYSSNIKVWLEETDLKKLSYPTTPHQDKSYSVNFCNIYIWWSFLFHVCTLYHWSSQTWEMEHIWGPAQFSSLFLPKLFILAFPVDLLGSFQYKRYYRCSKYTVQLNI